MIRQLYDVDADVQFHQRAGHLTVIAGAAEVDDASRAARHGAFSVRGRASVRGAAVRGRRAATARSPSRRVSSAPLVGSTHISLRARVRSLDSVCRQRRRADLLRRPHAARSDRRARRRDAGGGRRRHAGAAPQPARDAVHAWRLRRRGARRDPRHHIQHGRERRSTLARAAGQPRRRAARRPQSSTRSRRGRDARCRRWCCCSPASR